jgi:hypothetical protein
MARFFSTMICWLSCLGAVVPACAVATVWHVSPTGDDSASGTGDAPFATLHRAAVAAHAGDVVVIAEGVYHETLAPQSSGRKGAPITFAAARGAHPVVTGCDRVSGWRKMADGKWEASVAWDLGIGRNQIFWNGQLLIEARQPNLTDTNLMKPGVAPVHFLSKYTLQSEATSSDQPNRWAGALYWGHGWEAWSYQCAFVSSSISNQVTLDPATVSRPWFYELTPQAAAQASPGELLLGGVLMGVESMLDSPGEWYWRGKTIRLIPPSQGGAPIGADVEARRRNWAADLDGVDGIVIRGLKFVAGGIHIKGNDNHLDDCVSEFGSHFYVFTNGYAADGGMKQGSAVLIEGAANVVSNCVVSRTAGAGIRMLGAHNLVTRCLIEDVDYAGVYGAGISIAGKDNEVIFNTIRRTGRDGIHLAATKDEGSAGCRILFNDVSFPGQICKDCGIIYTWGNDGHPRGQAQARIAYNWLHDNLAPGPTGPGVYLDNYTRNFLVDHNVIWNCPKDSGVRLNAPAVGHRLYNNTLFNTRNIGTGVYNQFPEHNPAPEFWVRRDMFSYDARNNLSLGSEAGKLLNSPETDNFRLKAKLSSHCKNPAVGSGQYIEGFVQDLNGQAPDLGAYQTGQPRWTAGRHGQADARLLKEVESTP